MSKRISEDQQGVANRGLAKAQISKKNVDELHASVVESTYSNFSYSIGIGGSGDSIHVLISKGEIIFRNFNTAHSNKPLTKYRLAEAFLKLFNFMEQLAQKSRRNKNGVLLESYEVWVPVANSSSNRQENRWLPPDNNVPSFRVDIKYEMRPWTPLLPKKVTDIPVFSEKNKKIVTDYLLQTDPNAIKYEEPSTVSKNNDRSKVSKNNNDSPNVDSAEIEHENKNAEEELSIIIKIYPSKRFYELYDQFEKSEPKSPVILRELKIEFVASAIEMVSLKKISHEDAIEISEKVVNKFPVKFKPELVYSTIPVLDIDSVNGVKEIKEKNPAKFAFAPEVLYALESEFNITLNADIVELITRKQQKEVEKIFEIDKVKIALEAFLQSLTRTDYLLLLRAVNRNRLRLIQYVSHDFEELSSKRNSWFFKNFEGYYSKPFPSDYKASFSKAFDIIQFAQNLIDTRGISIVTDRDIERSLIASEIVYNIFLRARKALTEYEKEKEKYSRRAIAFMTLAIEVLTTVLTTGLMTWTKSLRLQSAIQIVLIPLAKQELYVQSGILSSRDFKSLAIDTPISLVTSKFSNALSNQFLLKFNLNLSNFGSKVIDTLLTSFTDAFQSQIVNLIRNNSASIDQFLKELFENIVTDTAGKVTIAGKSNIFQNAAEEAVKRLSTSNLGSKIITGDKTILADSGNLGKVRSLTDESAPLVQPTLAPSQHQGEANPPTIPPQPKRFISRALPDSFGEITRTIDQIRGIRAKGKGTPGANSDPAPSTSVKPPPKPPLPATEAIDDKTRGLDAPGIPSDTGNQAGPSRKRPIISADETIQDAFTDLKAFRKDSGAVPTSNDKGNPTFVRLDIDGETVYGSNTSAGGRPMEQVKMMKQLLKEVYGVAPHMEVMKHAEADALLDAYSKGLKGREAVLYVDKALCTWCGGKDGTGGSLKRLLPLLGIEKLTVWTMDETGQVRNFEIKPAESADGRKPNPRRRRKRVPVK